MMTSYTNQKFAVRSFLYTLGISLILLAPAAPAGAQSNDARLKRLENEVETLSRAIYKGERPPPGSIAMGEDVSPVNAANTELRLQQLEVQIRELTGTIEESNYNDQQFQSRIDQALAAFDMRLGALESRMNMPMSGGMAPGGYGMPQAAPYDGGGVSSGLQNMGDMDTSINNDFESYPPQAAPMDANAPPQQPSSAPTMGQLGSIQQTESYDAAPPLPANDPVGLYEQAFSYLKEQNYPMAESGFKQFLTEYADHDLAANAKYWLGESYYVRGDYDQAARTFAEAYQKYPKGPKGPDNLLKLGMSLAALDKKNDACLTYAQLRKDYPNGAMPILSRADQEMERLGCQ